MSPELSLTPLPSPSDSEGQRIVQLGSSRRKISTVQLSADTPALGVLTGLSPGVTTLDDERAKVAMATRRGIATVTDLTTSEDDRLLKTLLDQDIAVGTVPTYALITAVRHRQRDLATTLIKAIENQVLLGVDFLSIHPSLTHELVEKIPRSNRTIPITSRGGSLILQIMADTGAENPYRTVFDDLLAMCAQYGVVLSFVGSLRSGAVADAFERLHLAELAEISDLARRAHNAGVQTIVELVNHVSLTNIGPYIQFGRQMFPHSALGALGPSPTDIAVGLDDVAGAIGATVAALSGINWINIVTAGEHSHLPTLDDTTRAIDYFQLALHIAKVARGDLSRDRQLSAARAKNNWQAMSTMAIVPELAAQLYAEHGNRHGAACSMCRATCPLVRYETLVRRGAIDTRTGDE